MKNRKPEYLRLYELLRTGIIQGVWPYGARLPSRRQLAHEQGLSVVTVEHSYELLCQEGYAETRPRSGVFVCYRATDGFIDWTPASHREAPAVPSEEPAEAFPFSVLARAMRRVLSDYAEAVLRKAPNAGCLELREAISRYLARNRGIHAGVEEIVIGAGAEYLYGMVVEMLGRERVFGIESPSYEKIEQVYEARGVTCDLLPLGPEGIRSAALAATTASVLHISPFRSFPSGVTASASKRMEYLRWAGTGDRYIVEDDFESEFSLLRKPEDTVFSLSAGENVIYMNTFSRTVSPSIRVGYMVLPGPLVPIYQEKAGFYSCTVPTFEQYVLAELLDNGDFERHVNRIRRRKRRQEEKNADRPAQETR